MGITVHPAARSDRESENMNSVVRSSRSSELRAITAITRQFVIIFSVITALMIAVLTSLLIYVSITKKCCFYCRLPTKRTIVLNSTEI